MQAKKISKRAPKIKAFVEECLASGITSPSSMRDAYKEYWNKEATTEAFINAMRRLGVSSAQRKELAAEAVKEKEGKDISDYDQVKNYISRSERGSITENHLNRQLTDIRTLWDWMGNTNPSEWTEEQIHECIKRHVLMSKDDRGRMRFEKPAKVRYLLTSFNTMFPGILAKGWSAGFTEPGKMKDYLTFEEFDSFIEAEFDTSEMPREGWQARDTAQVNLGSREGTNSNTGIISLKWEDINFTTRRCKLNEKGGKGNAGRTWENLPLDLFTWLHGWDRLITWWQKCGQPTQGQVFPINYAQLLDHFHAVRKRCNGRIAGDLETMRPHVLRATHAQWLVKTWVPIELICGQFPNGYFGVGWDNPQILLKFYVTLEGEQYAKAEKIMAERMDKLGLVSPQPQTEPAITENVLT